jgi:hypothetical protein
LNQPRFQVEEFRLQGVYDPVRMFLALVVAMELSLCCFTLKQFCWNWFEDWNTNVLNWAKLLGPLTACSDG